jgi:hypothetical protein
MALTPKEVAALDAYTGTVTQCPRPRRGECAALLPPRRRPRLSDLSMKDARPAIDPELLKDPR